MNLLKRTLLAAASVALLATPAFAQQAYTDGAQAAKPQGAAVVAACGTPSTTYVAGSFYPQTMDTTGGTCTSPVPVPTTLFAASGNVGAGTASGLLSAAAGKTTYIAGLLVTGNGATAAGVIQCTVSNLLGGALGFDVTVPAGATVGITPINLNFNPPLAASGPNNGITVSCPSFGTGNTAEYVTTWGFRQ